MRKAIERGLRKEAGRLFKTKAAAQGFVKRVRGKSKVVKGPETITCPVGQVMDPSAIKLPRPVEGYRYVVYVDCKKK